MPCPQCREEFEELEERFRQFAAAFDEGNLNLHWHISTLTPTERKLLGLLHKKAGKAVAKEGLLQVLYFVGVRDEPDPKIIDVMICHIRKKLVGHNIHIATEWGFGYRYCEGEDPLLNPRLFKHGRSDRWTKDEHEILRRSKTITEAAIAIGRTPNAVYAQAQRIGHSWKTRRTHDAR